MISADARILIVLLGALGDVVRGLAVADRIKEYSPGVHITWLVEPKCRGIVELSDSVDEVLVFDRPSPLKGIGALRRALNARKFDIVLDMQRHAKSGFFSWLSGAKRRIGFHRSNAKEFNWIFQTESIEPADDSLNKFYHYQKFLLPLGILPSDSKKSRLKGTGAASKFTLPARYAVVVLGSSWHSKDWVPQGYDSLNRELQAKGIALVLVGDNSKRELASRLTVNRTDITTLVGETTLPELVDVIRGASFGVGPDSGPGHIAAALGVPYISLFGPTSPKRVAPIGYEHLVVTASIGCAPCYRRTCPGLDKLCMRLISVPAILDKVRVADRDLIR